MREVEKVNRCLAGIECSRIEIWKKVGIFFLLFLTLNASSVLILLFFISEPFMKYVG